jgi:hypothetical protein
MDNFYKEIMDLTISNVETRIELERQRQQLNVEKISEAIDSVFSNITNSVKKETAKIKITESASKGYSRCTLFEFDADAKEESSGLPLVFIFKGPRYDKGQGYGLRFFENINISPLFIRLKNEFCPFKVFLNYKVKDNKYTLDIVW